MEMKQLIDRLHKEGCSCVIHNDGQTLTFNQRGVKDLLTLLKERPSLLDGAMIADKVVGKGAAALMIAGGVSEVYADVISAPALALLQKSQTAISYGECVENIINRKGTGICPVESLCLDCTTANECIPLIESFITNLNN